MTRDEKIAEARRMRADGAILRVIGERFGVSPQTALRWTDDEFNARSLAACRANKLRYRGECVDCGTPTVGDAPGNAPARCVECNCANTRKLTRRWILDSFAEWHRLFGRPPGAADWEPQILPAGPQRDRAHARREATGRPWPGPSVVTNHFGSWNAGVEAAGFEACPAGRRRDVEAWRASIREAKGTDARRSLIAALFDEGLTYREIGEEMGVQERTIAGHIGRMRRDGWVLPLRATGPRPRGAVAA